MTKTNQRGEFFWFTYGTRGSENKSFEGADPWSYAPPSFLCRCKSTSRIFKITVRGVLMYGLIESKQTWHIKFMDIAYKKTRGVGFPDNDNLFCLYQ